MAPSLHLLLILFISLSLTFTSNAQPSFQPRALVLPVSKDASTLQYVTHLKQRTPLVSIKLALDLGDRFMWVNCEQDYVSSTYISPQWGSTPCTLASPNSQSTCFAGPNPGCNNNTCSLFPKNPFISLTTSGELAQDVISFQSTNGKNPGPCVSVPRFIFTCGSNILLDGLAKGVTGLLGLGRTRIALPLQLAATFKLPMKFAICLPSSTRSHGVIFFGDGPYVMRPNIDVSKSLSYTHLLINPVSTAGASLEGERSSEYFIDVKSIKINGQVIPLDTTLLAIKKGLGGTKISTTSPYTVMETSIYKAFTKAFVKASLRMNITRVTAIAPFKVCFRSNKVARTQVGLAVPTIDLVLQSENVFWRIFGANSMVQVRHGVMCLGFLDGGSEPTTSIVIGGHQLEDNLLQFDLKISMLGFSSSLLSKRTTCSNFNFTSSV